MPEIPHNKTNGRHQNPGGAVDIRANSREPVRQHGKSILKPAMPNPNGSSPGAQTVKKDADYVFYELTRSICPVCRAVIDAQILIRDNKVYMRKRCAQHGPF